MPTATLTGVVEIDSAIQSAAVFIDFNNDNLLGTNEPRVATDATGHFTLTRDNIGPLYAKTVGAIATAQACFELHMRAPLGDTSGDEHVGNAVISPFTTLVVSEMAAKPSLTRRCRGDGGRRAHRLAGAVLRSGRCPWRTTLLTSRPRPTVVSCVLSRARSAPSCRRRSRSANELRSNTECTTRCSSIPRSSQ